VRIEVSPRKSREIPTLSGVYQILCAQNGKIYIGSAINLESRWHSHRRDLRNGVHVNPHLQFAWNLYGETSFEFSVLEYVDELRLLVTEQSWINKTGCTNRRIGFNIKLEATSAGQGIGRTWDGFHDPSGNSVTIVNLAEFCRRNRLTFGAMLRLFKGRSKLKSHKGWTHVNSVRQREFIKTHDGFVNPSGKPVGPIRNLAAFCRDNGLDNPHMTAVASGRILSHRGWTHLRGRKRSPPLIHRGFIAPGGAVVRITNLSAFCRAAGLCKVHMFELKNGTRPSHKGWTWKHDADKAFE
jgi:group I intron endonuclease